LSIKLGFHANLSAGYEKLKRKRSTSLSRAKTRLELAEEYGISRRTLTRRLKALNIQIPSGRFAPADLKRIYQALGEPPYRKEEEKR